MCVTCGCGEGEVRIDGATATVAGAPHAHLHRHADGTVHAHSHEHGDAHDHDHADAYGHGHGHSHDLGYSHDHGQSHDHAHPHDHADRHDHADPRDHVQRHAHAHGNDHVHPHPDDATIAAAPAGALGAVHAPGVDATRRVQIERDLLTKNDAIAAANRRLFAARGIFALNLVSSPGSGKTTLLVKTIEALGGRIPALVIEGDQQTSRDAERIRATGARAVQVNTGKGCHLDADMVARALDRLDPPSGSLVLIENVGNLVCPAAFDLGEAHKVAILSVTEGDDKPIKYPDLFHAADLMLVNKVDLLPHVDFDVDGAIGWARRVQPGIGVMRISARTGEGFDAWLAWLERGVERARARAAAGATLSRAAEPARLD
jgi:hydrogenase nickel incorporation protein HypB